MVIIPIISLKGGVGKSTISINIADILSSNYKVLLIDSDPQNSISFLLCKELKSGLSEILLNDLEINDFIQKFDDSFYFLSNGMLGVNDFFEYEKNFFKFKNVLNSLNKFDIIIIDSPPQISNITKLLIEISTIFIFVTAAKPASIASLKLFLDYFDTKYLDKLRVAVNMIEPNELNEEFYLYIRSLVNNVVITLPKDDSVVESEANCMPVRFYDRNSAFLKALITDIDKLIEEIN